MELKAFALWHDGIYGDGIAAAVAYVAAIRHPAYGIGFGIGDAVVVNNAVGVCRPVCG